MSFALNKSLAARWRREVQPFDDMGSPNFDAVAMEKSSISPLLCTDCYRIGKSLRRRGFTTEGLKDDIGFYEENINRLIGEWLRIDAPVRIESEGDHLTSPKYWSTTLDGVEVGMPCGGTHVSRLSEIGTVIVNLNIPDDETLIITTSVR
jgi:alanyl-tRNA synthetase